MNLRTLKSIEVYNFTNTLSTFDWRKLKQSDFDKIRDFTKSDGCTGVIDFYLNGCTLHDFFYRTHKNLYGNEMTKAEADLILKKYIQSKSLFGRFSPMAWWRWEGVKHLADKAWHD